MREMITAFPHWSFEGVDISQKNVAVACGKGLNVRLADACSLDFAEQYDLIYGTAFLHHLESVPAFFTAASRRLKPGGALLIGAEPVYYGWPHILYHKLRGSWYAEKGLLNIDPVRIRRDLGTFCSYVRIDVHGHPFLYWWRPLGVVWNALCLSRIPGLNDIYIFARKKM
jgi:SAM-dependent methyltransferase